MARWWGVFSYYLSFDSAGSPMSELNLLRRGMDWISFVHRYVSVRGKPRTALGAVWQGTRSVIAAIVG